MITINNQSSPIKGAIGKKAAKKQHAKANNASFGAVWSGHKAIEPQDSDTYEQPLEAASSVEGGPSIEATSSVAAADSVLGLLSLQQTRKKDDFLYDHRQEASKKWGKEVLGKLDEIRLAILSGRLSEDKLIQLASLAGSRKLDVNDERLQDILQDIHTRALVELAKHRKAKQQAG